MAVGLPNTPETRNIRSLANWKAERVSGITGSVLTFTNTIDREAALLFKNGALVDPQAYTIVGVTIELGSAATGTDVFVLHYHYRTS